MLGVQSLGRVRMEDTRVYKKNYGIFNIFIDYI